MTKTTISEILWDYHHCGDIDSCAECRADQPINAVKEHDDNTVRSYCDLLREQRRYVEERLIKFIDNEL